MNAHTGTYSHTPPRTHHRHVLTHTTTYALTHLVQHTCTHTGTYSHNHYIHTNVPSSAPARPMSTFMLSGSQLSSLRSSTSMVDSPVTHSAHAMSMTKMIKRVASRCMYLCVCVCLHTNAYACWCESRHLLGSSSTRTARTQ